MTSEAAGTAPTTRCPWPGDDPLYVAYHDDEWGVPVRDDAALFQMLLLEGFQAGLSWITVLRRRETILQAFAGFDAGIIAGWGEAEQAKLMQDPGIIRNGAKIRAAIGNAQAYRAIRDQGGEGAFADLLWSVVGGEPQINRWSVMAEAPAETDASRRMSKLLSGRGFRFCGPTICYAFMQAVGMVNDHLVSCFRHRALGG